MIFKHHMDHGLTKVIDNMPPVIRGHMRMFLETIEQDNMVLDRALARIARSKAGPSKVARQRRFARFAKTVGPLPACTSIMPGGQQVFFLALVHQGKVENNYAEWNVIAMLYDFSDDNHLLKPREILSFSIHSLMRWFERGRADEVIEEIVGLLHGVESLKRWAGTAELLRTGMMQERIGFPSELTGGAWVAAPGVVSGVRTPENMTGTLYVHTYLNGAQLSLEQADNLRDLEDTDPDDRDRLADLSGEAVWLPADLL